MARKRKTTNYWLAVIIVGALAVIAVNGSGLLQGFGTADSACGVDGACDGVVETCLTCPEDCGPCTCIDNDGGINARDAGKCETSSLPLKAFYDYCQGEKIVEYYCGIEGTCKHTAINCVHGCSDGGCI